MLIEEPVDPIKPDNVPLTKYLRLTSIVDVKFFTHLRSAPALIKSPITLSVGYRI